MRPLYLQIYLGFLAVLAVFTLVVVLWGWTAHPGERPVPPFLLETARMAGERLPPAGAPERTVERALSRLAERLDADASLWDTNGRRVARIGDRLERPQLPEAGARWTARSGHGSEALAVRLSDGRTLGLAVRRGPHRPFGRWLAGNVVLALVMAVGAWPIARRIAARLERLCDAADELGQGDLDARVRIDGNDEVARLATSFNRAADRLQHLIEAQRRMLASASHELRSPLARLRMAVELLARSPDAKTASEAERDIEELDVETGDAESFCALSVS